MTVRLAEPPSSSSRTTERRRHPFRWTVALLGALVACAPALDDAGQRLRPGQGAEDDASDASKACGNDKDADEDCTDSDEDVRRFKIAEDLADPDVLQLDDDHYVVSGTQGNRFPFYESTDFVKWKKTTDYDPSRLDPNNDYCFLWAPDIVKDGGKLYFYFSAQRIGNGAVCPASANDSVATFRAVSEDGSLNFGKPEPLFPGSTGARTYPQTGCPPQGCNRAIRIDPTLYDGRLYYVYFADGGNNIASISMTNNSDIRIHTSVASMNAYEEKINEAPELFERNGKQYLFFSAAFYNSQYATFYMMGDSTSELTRSRPVQRLTTPVRRKNGNLIESHGHNSITTHRGNVYNFFHMGVFDSSGRLTRRDTYRQRLNFNADGTLMSQNEVRVSWPSAGSSSTYSLGLVLRDGTTVAGCIDAGRNTSATFIGICPNASDRLVHKGEVAKFRLFKGQQQISELDYDGYSDKVSMTLRRDDDSAE